MICGRIIRILIKCVKIVILTLTPPQRGGEGPMDSIFLFLDAAEKIAFDGSEKRVKFGWWGAVKILAPMLKIRTPIPTTCMVCCTISMNDSMYSECDAGNDVALRVILQHI